METGHPSTRVVETGLYINRRRQAAVYHWLLSQHTALCEPSVTNKFVNSLNLNLTVVN